MNACYIHIPFCDSICNYCDFCKMNYNQNMVDNYLKELEKEIDSKYKGDVEKTIYIGGGTPTCLSTNELELLLKIVDKIKKNKICEYTIESNVENITVEKVKLLKKYGINRISLGVQTVNPEHINFLGRNHNRKMVSDAIKLLKKYGVNNINVDLIYAIPSQTIEDLKEDLDFIVSLNITHISTYSLMIEPHTKLFIDSVKPISEDLDYEMYHYIEIYLEEHGFNHYETSNYSKVGCESKHNLTYWNNDRYYGFGLGASGYIDNTRYTNTSSINKYIGGNYILDEEVINRNTDIENTFILGFRKIKGINKQDFFNKYGVETNSFKVVKELIEEHKLIDDGTSIYINHDYLYISNTILYKFIGMMGDENNE